MRIVFPLLALIGLYTVALLFHMAMIDPKPRALSLTVSPQIGFAPRDLVILIRLQPLAEDRILRVILDGPDYSRSSAWDLQGDASPRFFRVDWKAVGIVDSEVVGSVETQSRTVRATARQHVILTAP